MTHDILQSDIDLAIKLRDDQRSDDEIILALVHRGVDPGPAARGGLLGGLLLEWKARADLARSRAKRSFPATAGLG